MKVANIIQGWGKTLRLLETSPQEKRMSLQRLKECANCPLAKESSLLKLIRGKGYTIKVLYCKGCQCPVNEKSLVKNEKCPEGKWEL